MEEFEKELLAVLQSIDGTLKKTFSVKKQIALIR
jgi:hypothetical protein